MTFNVPGDDGADTRLASAAVTLTPADWLERSSLICSEVSVQKQMGFLLSGACSSATANAANISGFSQTCYHMPETLMD